MLDDIHQTWLLQSRRQLFGYACALCADTASAEDLYQDTMVRAMSAASVPDDPTAYRVWLFRILRNLWIDRLRAAGRLPDVDDGTEVDQMPSGQGGDQVVNALAVRQAFGRLSKAHRDILALVDICGFSYADAAQMLDTPTGTIMSRISRARAALAARMDEDRTVVALPLHRAARRKGQRA